jgi:GT2 family glycosyltransferase
MIDPGLPDYTNLPVSPQRPSFGYAPSDPVALPCVTIVTPFYNTGPVFHETARSVLRQSLQQWEWLIVNDGSTDPEAIALLEDYQQRDPRIRVITHDTNRGLSTARNTGFRAARTPYVIQLDSDDLLEPTAVEKWVWCLESYPEFAFVKGYTVGFGAQEYLWQRGFHDGRVFLEENSVAPTAAIRTPVHNAVGGYDETIRGGLEDWDFWLRCASCGYWGGTIPEYLDWYRRRPMHGDRWTNWDNAEHQRAFHAQLRQRYRHLWKGGFPQIPLDKPLPGTTVPDEVPYVNCLQRGKPRLLMIVPWLTRGEVDQCNLDLLEQLTLRGWEVSMATTQQGDHSWLPRFAQYTPDIFILPHFLRSLDYPRFLRYLIQSRRPGVVLISHSKLGYLLLPYLRAHCPEVTFIDLCHIETPWWKNGGYPRMAVEYQGQLDLNIVVSEHLRRSMMEQGTGPQYAEVPAGLLQDPKRGQEVGQSRRRRVSSHFRLEQIGEQVIALLQEAMLLHGTQPRPVPSLDSSQVSAAQAVEHVQLVEEMDNLWGEPARQGSLRLLSPVCKPPGGQWRMSLYFALRRRLLPYYRVGLTRNMRWLLFLKNKVKRVLLGEVWS